MVLANSPLSRGCASHRNDRLRQNTYQHVPVVWCARCADYRAQLPVHGLAQGCTEADAQLERQDREAFVDFLLGVLDMDPATRWTPRQVPRRHDLCCALTPRRHRDHRRHPVEASVSRRQHSTH